jgi:DNA-binding transcriptional regulator YhcF (GntR family)
MKIWISKGSEVPVREQLTTQIMLAVASGELKPGQRLPSIRELARRFEIHSNTANAAYRDLASQGWLEFRKGSGVYVRVLDQEVPLDARLEFHLVAQTSLEELRSYVRGFLSERDSG